MALAMARAVVSMVCSRRSSAAVDGRGLRDVATRLSIDRCAASTQKSMLGTGDVAAFAGERAREVGDLRRAAPRRRTEPPRRSALPKRRRKRVSSSRTSSTGVTVRAQVVGQRLQRLAGERQAVAGAGDDAGDSAGSGPPRRAGIGERDQVAGEIAAVDRRDIRRIERAKIARVVPIVEVAAEPLQPFHRGERRFEALDRLERADPAEVARGDRRQKIEADIGGRGPVRDDRARILLEVVRRQHVVRRR